MKLPLNGTFCTFDNDFCAHDDGVFWNNLQWKKQSQIDKIELWNQATLQKTLTYFALSMQITTTWFD